jgi:hypothetical protein
MNEAQRSEESGDEGANLTGLLCDCHLCKGTGKVEAEFNEIDLLMQSFNSGQSEKQHIIEVAMNRFNVKKGKRKHVARIINDALEQLKY